MPRATVPIKWRQFMKKLFLSGLFLSLGIQGFESASDFKKKVNKLEDLFKAEELASLVDNVHFEHICNNLAAYEQELGVNSKFVTKWAERCNSKSLNIETKRTSSKDADKLFNKLTQLVKTQELGELLEIEAESLCELAALENMLNTSNSNFIANNCAK